MYKRKIQMVKAGRIMKKYCSQLYKKSNGNGKHLPWVMSAKHMLDEAAPPGHHSFLSDRFPG